ncbi:unnamed protein product [Amoebophrya sp. A120]|nr:unnamed protein product [Amoebophrya sp. A120]|eukprot:GSA120T00024352001.1
MSDYAVVNPKLLCALARQAALANAEFDKEDAGISNVEVLSDGFSISAVISGPEQTAFFGGCFKVLLQIPATNFPSSPPKAFFLTKIFHPNINSTNGDVCVNALQKDWDPAKWSLAHIFRVIRCLLIIPFPESALNPEAARLFMEDYQEFCAHAKMMVNVHARTRMQPGAGSDKENSQQRRGTGVANAKVTCSASGAAPNGTTTKTGASCESRQVVIKNAKDLASGDPACAAKATTNSGATTSALGGGGTGTHGSSKLGGMQMAAKKSKSALRRL